MDASGWVTNKPVRRIIRQNLVETLKSKESHILAPSSPAWACICIPLSTWINPAHIQGNMRTQCSVCLRSSLDVRKYMLGVNSMFLVVVPSQPELFEEIYESSVNPEKFECSARALQHRDVIESNCEHSCECPIEIRLTVGWWSNETLRIANRILVQNKV